MKKNKTNKHPKHTRPLTLARHTLRLLSRDALANVGGGSEESPTLQSCWSDCC